MTTLPAHVVQKVLQSTLHFFCDLVGQEMLVAMHFTTCMPGLAFTHLHTDEHVSHK